MLSSNSSFALIAPVFLLLLGLSQWMAWCFLRKPPALFSQGAAFLAASAGMLMQLVGWKEPFWSRVLAFSCCYLCAAIWTAHSIGQRLHVQLRLHWLLAIAAILLAALMWFTVQQPSMLVRVYLLSLGVTGLLGLPLLGWKRMRVRNAFDNAWRWVYVSLIVLNLARTVVQLPWNGAQLMPYQAGQFMGSFFWLFLDILLMVICMCATSCLLFAEVQDELDRLAAERAQDPLTKLHNRRGFEEMSLQVLAQASSHAASMRYAVLLCDIDHFKHINDRWGHAIGDEVLKHTACVLKANSRDGDIVARIGGEEFVCLLRTTSEQSACAVAQRMCRAISEMALPELCEQRITMSVGVAALTQMNQAGLQAALRLADERMYAAKQAGRNRVVDAQGTA